MLDPGQDAPARDAVANEAKSQIEATGTLKHENVWGLRKMAYEINKRNEADYRWFRFEAPTELLEQLDHNLKIADGVLRFRIFKVDADTPVMVPPATSAPGPARVARAALRAARRRPRRRPRAAVEAPLPPPSPSPSRQRRRRRPPSPPPSRLSPSRAAEPAAEAPEPAAETPEPEAPPRASPATPPLSSSFRADSGFGGESCAACALRLVSR